MPVTYQKIYTIVKKIPRGKVATYGQIAHLVGIPSQPRRIGYALSALNEDSNVPWQRVINAQGKISPRPFSDRQRTLLEKEGIIFTEGSQIDLQKFQWEPHISSTPNRKRKKEDI